MPSDTIQGISTFDSLVNSDLSEYQIQHMYAVGAKRDQGLLLAVDSQTDRFLAFTNPATMSACMKLLMPCHFTILKLLGMVNCRSYDRAFSLFHIREFADVMRREAFRLITEKDLVRYRNGVPAGEAPPFRWEAEPPTHYRLEREHYLVKIEKAIEAL
jgi:hypothetical protein